MVKKVTTEDITALIEHIYKEFPDGCRGVRCAECKLEYVEEGTREYQICKMLQYA